MITIGTAALYYSGILRGGSTSPENPDGKTESYQDFVFAWMNETNLYRQTLTLFGALSALGYATMQKVGPLSLKALAPLGATFLVGLAAVEYLYATYNWVLPNATEKKANARENLIKFLQANYAMTYDYSSASNKGLLNCAEKQQQNLTDKPNLLLRLQTLIKKLKISRSNYSCAQWGAAIGWSLAASTAASFLTPGSLTSLCGYAAPIAGAAATYLVGIVTLGVGGVVFCRGLEMRKRAFKTLELENEALKSLNEFAKGYTKTKNIDLESKKNELEKILTNLCALEGGKDTYLGKNIKGITASADFEKYLLDLHKAISANISKQNIACFVGGSMIFGGVLTLAAAGLTLGKSIAAVNMITAISAVFYIAMESTFGVYDSSWLFDAYFNTCVYKEPDWASTLPTQAGGALLKTVGDSTVITRVLQDQKQPKIQWSKHSES